MSKSKLITTAGTPTAYTGNRETDARTAITRGLADYLSTVRVEARGGRVLQFQDIQETWAEPEENAQYPAAAVYSLEEGVYDASKLTPQPADRFILPAPDGRVLVSPAEFNLNVKVDVWANDPTARRELVAACEEAFNPVSFMYGFILELPHYYNERAVFELVSSVYLDTEEDAMRRYRRATFTLKAQVPVIRLFRFPLSTVAARLDQVGPDVVVTQTVNVS